MSRTVSTRISVQLHEELRERCNKIGCSISDYVVEAIKFAVYGNSDFDFEEPEEETN